MLIKASDKILIEFWTRGDRDNFWVNDHEGNTYLVLVTSDGEVLLTPTKYVPSPSVANGTVSLPSFASGLEYAQRFNRR